MTLKNNETMEVLTKLAQSPKTFYLTGSRFFGCENFSSDWDFFTRDTPETRQFLESIGFVAAPSEKYEKPLQEVTAIYRFLKPEHAAFIKKFPRTLRRGDYLIDIQLSTNVEKKNRIQHVLKQTLGNQAPSNSMWEFAYRLLA